MLSQFVRPTNHYSVPYPLLLRSKKPKRKTLVSNGKSKIVVRRLTERPTVICKLICHQVTHSGTGRSSKLESLRVGCAPVPPYPNYPVSLELELETLELEVADLWPVRSSSRLRAPGPAATPPCLADGRRKDISRFTETVTVSFFFDLLGFDNDLPPTDK